MASKRSTQARAGTSNVDVDEVLGDLETLVDRLRVMYEQYFLGIQRAAPSHMHSDAERRLRDIAQLQIRNTAQRYRLATLNQKFGSFNSYWKRTVRDIEAGRYIRDLSRIQRQSAQSGEDIPEEVLAAMPKRMRQMVERDRKAANEAAKRRGNKADSVAPALAATAGTAATASASKPRSTTHALDDSLIGDDFDIDEMFRAVASNTVPPPLATARTRTGQPRKRPTSGSDFLLPRTRTGNPARLGVPTTPPVPVTSPASRAAAPLYLTDDDDLVPAPQNRRAPTVAPPTVPAARAATSVPPLPPPMPPRSAVLPPAARPIAPPAPATPPPPGMSESETRALYAKYVKAREVVRDGSETMSYDRLVRHLRQQAPKIMEAHKASGVEFGIVIKDNKIVIKAKPKT